MSSRTNWVQLFLRLPFPFKVAVGLTVLMLLLIAYLNQPRTKPVENVDIPQEGYLFCFWNVENLFDDVNDRRRQPDDRFDDEFASKPELRQTKLRNLSKVLLAMNGGRGPDILAVAEVENERALELLQKQLNDDLGQKAPHYSHRLFHEQKQGRNIAPGILTRLPVDANRTHQLGQSYHRILEGHLLVNKQQLVVVVSHWTSRVSRPGAKDETKNEESRKKYADVIHGRFREMYTANPKIDFLVCGDFNDDPDDDSVVHHLKGIGDQTRLGQEGGPYLFNLAANRDLEKFGTLSHNNRWNLFDQILVSPGLLDSEGWTCDPRTFRTERENMANRKGRPWRFDEDDEGHRHYDKKFNGKRGFADHFPVTVRLNVK